MGVGRVRASGPVVAAAIVVATLVGAVLRVPSIDREVSHDEAFSWLSYAAVSYERVFTSYDLPNNHILHTGLMRLAAQIAGGHEEWVLRMPALLAGVATIPVTAALAATALGNPVAGAAAAWCLALHPTHVAYSGTARGYSLLVLFAALSWWAALRALQGDRRMWGAFAAAALLATWTIPSGAFVLIALSISSALVAWRHAGLAGVWPVLRAAGFAGLASVVAYLPVLEEVLVATRTWGLEIWPAPLAAMSSLGTGILLLSGAASMAVLGALGWGRLALQRRELALHVALAVMIPILAAISSGVAGPPRSYLFLLPAAVALPCVWVNETKAWLRRAGSVLFGLALVHGGWSSMQQSNSAHGYAALGEHFASRGSVDALLAPIYLDVPLDMYTREAETANLLQALRQKRLEGLLFARQDSDKRATFERYSLFADNHVRFELWLPEHRFAEVFRAGDVSLSALHDGVTLYPLDETVWSVASGSARVRLDKRAFGPAPALGVLAMDTDFLILEQARFTPHTAGVTAIIAARRGDDVVHPSLCSESGGSWRREQAFRGQVQAIEAEDEDGRLWALELRVVFMQAGITYAPCLAGSGEGTAYVGDLLYTYFPLQQNQLSSESERKIADESLSGG